METKKDHLQELLETHENRLHHLKLQAAIKGINVEPEISIEINKIEEKITSLKRDLEQSTNSNKEKILEESTTEQSTPNVVKKSPKPKKNSLRYNVVVLGKTGVGKTSLINYLYGQEIGLTGDGKPIQAEFIPLDFEINEQLVRVFDSEGITAGNASAWDEKLELFLAQYGIDKPPTEWLHAIFYCFAVGGSRIEEFEIELIRRLLENNYRLTVVFTKADQSHKEAIYGLQKCLNEAVDRRLPIITVCSVAGERLDGSEIKQFGKAELEGQIYLDFWNSICQRLPERCELLALQMIDEWEKAQRSEIDHLVSAGCNLDYIYSKLKDRTARFSKALNHQIADMVNREIEETMEMFDAFSTALKYPPDWVQEFTKIKFGVNFYSYTKGNVGSVIGSVFSLGTIFTNNWDSYVNDIKEQIDKFSLEPGKRKREMLSDLNSVISRLQRMIKGEKSRFSRLFYSRLNRDESDEPKGVKSIVADTLWAMNPIKN